MHVYLAEGVEAGDAEPEDDEELELIRWHVDELANEGDGARGREEHRGRPSVPAPPPEPLESRAS